MAEVIDEHSFEDALALLEDIVKSLEEGNMSLDESLQKFEQGIRLSRLCNSKLDDAEKKINLLLKNTDGSLVIKPADILEGNHE